MNRLPLSLALVLALIPPARGADEKDLNGTWLAVKATRSGEAVGEDFFKGSQVTFADGKYTATLGEVTDQGTYKVDRSKKPNTLDMQTGPVGKKKKGLTMPAIFELNGDTLTISYGAATFERPRDFTSTAENKHFVVVYQRKK